MKLVNFAALLAVLAMCVWIGWELWTGMAVRNPGPWIERATQPGAYWAHVGSKAIIVVIGVTLLFSNWKKS